MKIVKKFVIGKKVNHNIFKNGTIVNETEKTFEVDFDGNRKTFLKSKFSKN